jgi:hypothetical protein
VATKRRDICRVAFIQKTGSVSTLNVYLLFKLLGYSLFSVCGG